MSTSAAEITELHIYETDITELTTVNVSFMIILEINIADITDTTLTSIQNEFENVSQIQIELIDIILVKSDESDTTTTTTDMPSIESDKKKSDSNYIIIIVVGSVSVLLICLCGGLIYCKYVKRRTESIGVEMVRYESNFKGKPPPPFTVNLCVYIHIHTLQFMTQIWSKSYLCKETPLSGRP